MGGNIMYTFWNDSEIDYLKSNLDKEIDFIANKLNKSINAIIIKAQRLGLRFETRRQEWSDSQIDYLIKNFALEDNHILSEKLNKSTCSITSKANKLGLHKSDKWNNFTFAEKIYGLIDNVELVTEYKNLTTKIRCKCLIHNLIWNAKPSDLLNGKRGCRKCFKSKKRTHEEFIEELREINKNIIVLGVFEKATKKILVQCLIDGYTWEMLPSQLLKGNGCHRCGKVEQYTPEAFKEKMKCLVPDIEIIGDYVDVETKIKVKCLRDGNIWSISPRCLYRGVGCPYCKGSKGERKAIDHLKKLNIQYKHQYQFKDLMGLHGFALRFDLGIFYNNTLFCLIEIDGIGHRKPIKFNGMGQEEALRRFELTKLYDSMKDEYCAKNEIKLYRIDYDGKNFEDIYAVIDEILITMKGGENIAECTKV
jgi:hypothetical protein